MSEKMRDYLTRLPPIDTVQKNTPCVLHDRTFDSQSIWFPIKRMNPLAGYDVQFMVLFIIQLTSAKL